MMSEINPDKGSGEKPPPDETAAPPASAPLRLEYAPAPHFPVVAKVAGAVSGVILAAITVWIVGAMLWPYPIDAPAPPGPPIWFAVIGFFMLAPLALVGAAALLRRRPFRQGTWFLLGLLIGLGIAGLLEGACWSAK